MGCLFRFSGGKYTIIKKDKFFVHGLSKKEVLTSLRNLIKELMAEAIPHKVLGIGIGLPGQIDHKKNKLLRAPNIVFLKEINWTKDIGTFFGISVKMENDANCFTLAEALFGQGKGKRFVFGMTLGTGIGGGFVVDGKLFQGENGAACEVGHMIIDRDKSFEHLGSGKGIKIYTHEDPKVVEDKARAGDKKAKEVYHILGKNIGIGVANIINIVNPGIFVFGGGISYALGLMEKDIRKQIELLAVSPIAKKTKFVQSKLGREGGALGAAALFVN